MPFGRNAHVRNDWLSHRIQEKLDKCKRSKQYKACSSGRRGHTHMACLIFRLNWERKDASQTQDAVSLSTPGPKSVPEKVITQQAIIKLPWPPLRFWSVQLCARAAKQLGRPHRRGLARALSAAKKYKWLETPFFVYWKWHACSIYLLCTKLRKLNYNLFVKILMNGNYSLKACARQRYLLQLPSRPRIDDCKNCTKYPLSNTRALGNHLVYN